MSGTPDELEMLIRDFEGYLTRSFERLWAGVKVEPDFLESYSVVGALLARQVTLAIQLTRSPGTWNGHSAPLFLRAMVDLHITLGWMMGDLHTRAKAYIQHGLVDVKLLVEHYRAKLQEDPNASNASRLARIIETRESWVNAQRREMFVEVNLGHWAQLDTRKMASESGNEELYKFAYKPFSHAAHNMWPHVSVYNAALCSQPLHRYHLVPVLSEPPFDLDFLYRACKYVDKTYSLFDTKWGVKLTNLPRPLEWWRAYFSDDSAVKSDG